MSESTMVNFIDFVSGKMDCEVCKKKGTTPPGRMSFTGKRLVMEPESDDFWRFTEYEMKCDLCGATMTSETAGPRPGLRWALKRDLIQSKMES